MVTWPVFFVYLQVVDRLNAFGTRLRLVIIQKSLGKHHNFSRISGIMKLMKLALARWHRNRARSCPEERS